MSPAIAEAKRAAGATASRAASYPTQAQWDQAVIAQERVVADLQALCRQAELGEAHGATYSRPDPQKVSEAKTRLEALRQHAPLAKSRGAQLAVDADRAARNYRRLVYDAIISGPRARAVDRLQSALASLRDAAAELMGVDHAASTQFGRRDYGAAAALMKAIDDVTSRGATAADLRPSWLPWNGLVPHSLPGVAEASAATMAMVEGAPA